MTPQDHASHLLQVWQQRRAMPPVLRLIDCPPLVPAEDVDYDATLEDVAEAMSDV